MAHIENYYSDEVQEIMGRIPPWIVRWGITAIFVIFAAILVGSYFIRYPETVEVCGMIIPGNVSDDPERRVENRDFVRDRTTAVIGRLHIPSGDLGRIRPGQVVYMELSGYPHMEFGKLKGYVRSISPAPKYVRTYSGLTTVYSAEVEFPEGLTTTYRRELPVIWQMDGTAEIITENTRLIFRMIRPIASFCKTY